MTDLEKLGKYEIRRELGRGAMGIVYEGYDPLIKRSVALKTIRADQLSGENAETVIARFRREAQAAGRLSHPNIVSIYDFGEEEGIWYIAMELVKGRELKDYFQANERFSMPDIARILTKILDALDYSHRHGVVHRDIKPANIILLPDGGVKVADFGVAHIETSNMTQAGTTLGTPAYMSPEQILGLPVDGRSDIFSAGVILYQFLTGERPFTGTSTVTMRKVLEENPLPPSRFNVQTSPAMDDVVRKALAKKPEDRFQNAAEFAAALNAAANLDATSSSRAVSAAEPTLLATTPASAATVMAPATPSKSSPTVPTPSKQSQTTAIAIVAAAALVAVGVGVWFVMQRNSSTATTTTTVASAPTHAIKAPAAPPPAPPAPVVAAAEPAKADPKALSISAVGLIDPTDARYQNDKAALQNDLRADSKSQLIEKALTLLLDRKSLAKNYDVLKERLLSNSGNYITAVVQESAPQTGKDGLVSMTTQAVVNVKALQKSLNDMSRAERIELIRANGDPKISVRILARDADIPEAPPQPSSLAENLLKERIKSFGFRTWSDDGAARATANPDGADFAVIGEVAIKKLSRRLEASGITVTKYTLASYTLKVVDRATGEEIHHNTSMPTGLGSWASEGEALQAIGAKIADEMSRDLFLQHLNVTGNKITVVVEGLPTSVSDELLQRELVGLPAVISAMPSNVPRTYDLKIGGAGSPGDIVAAGVLTPLNAKLGQPCFGLGAVASERVSVIFDKTCDDPTILGRLETNPPAGLYTAPPSRQKTVVKNPETLKKLIT